MVHCAGIYHDLPLWFGVDHQPPQVHLKGFQLAESWTEPPKPLTEAELVELMDQNGIGTDASIPQHIQTIQDRALTGTDIF